MLRQIRDLLTWPMLCLLLFAVCAAAGTLVKLIANPAAANAIRKFIETLLFIGNAKRMRRHPVPPL